MAERGAGDIPQVIDEAFVDEMIRDLQVVGRLGVLNVSDGIVPVYLLGQRTAFQVEVQNPFFATGEFFTAGAQVNPAANTVLADTTALPVGVYDLIVEFTMTGGGVRFLVQHRNAANAVTLTEWQAFVGVNGPMYYRWVLGFQLAASERLRVLNSAAPGAGITAYASIAAKIRA